MATLNPSTVMHEGEPVATADPMTATQVAAGLPGADVVINPRELIVNGEPVSALNPFPLTLV